MKKLILILPALVALLTACNKDEPIPSLQTEERFSFTGKWFAPDMSWFFSAEFHQAEPNYYIYIKQIYENPDTCNIVFLNQSELTWRRPAYDPITGGLFLFSTYTYEINSDTSKITFYEGNRIVKECQLQIISPTEMLIDDVVYLKEKINPTPMPTLPNEEWHYDFVDENGVYYTGSNQLDFNNPIYTMRGSSLYVYYNIYGYQAVRPTADYSSLPVRPKSCLQMFPNPGPAQFTVQQIDYNGTAISAYVQVSGGNPNRICKYAFSGLKNVTSLVVCHTSIDEYALWGCSLNGIYVYEPNIQYGEDSMEVAETAFDEYTYEHTPLHIPHGMTLDPTSPWARFKYIFDDLLSY